MTQILLKPIITEKSINATGSQWFTFATVKSSNKQQIKQAVESQFGVTVKAVRTQIVKNKTKRVGKKRQELQGQVFKKARVLLAKDQKIDLFEVATQ